MPANEVKNSVLFLCHSHEDKFFTDELLKLLETIGFDSSTLFYSSDPEYGLELGDNIIESIREKFSNKRLFVLYVLSPRVYKSAMSLNEMGAAWVLSTKSITMLTPDMASDKVKGVVADGTLAIQFSDMEETKHRLTEMKDELIKFFGFDQVEPTDWETNLDFFTTFVATLTLPDGGSDTDDSDTDVIGVMSDEARGKIEHRLNQLKSPFSDTGKDLMLLNFCLKDVLNTDDYKKYKEIIEDILSAQDNITEGNEVVFNLRKVIRLIDSLEDFIKR